MENYALVNFSGFYDRARSASGTKTDREFAALLGISQPDFANRKKRGTLKSLILEWAERTDIDLNWLFKGKEPGEASFDRDLLREIIVYIDNEIERSRDDHDFSIDPERKAEAIVMLYEEFVEDGEMNKEKVNKIVRLIR